MIADTVGLEFSQIPLTIVAVSYSRLSSPLSMAHRTVSEVITLYIGHLFGHLTLEHDPA